MLHKLARSTANESLGVAARSVAEVEEAIGQDVVELGVHGRRAVGAAFLGKRADSVTGLSHGLLIIEARVGTRLGRRQHEKLVGRVVRCRAGGREDEETGGRRNGVHFESRLVGLDVV